MCIRPGAALCCACWAPPRCTACAPNRELGGRQLLPVAVEHCAVQPLWVVPAGALHYGGGGGGGGGGSLAGGPDILPILGQTLCPPPLLGFPARFLDSNWGREAGRLVPAGPTSRLAWRCSRPGWRPLPCVPAPHLCFCANVWSSWRDACSNQAQRRLSMGRSVASAAIHIPKML